MLCMAPTHNPQAHGSVPLHQAWPLAPPAGPLSPPSTLFSALTAWLQDLEAGPIKSFSFSKVPPSQPASPGSSVTDLFSAPDFVVGSTTGNIVAVNCQTFEHPSSDQPSHRLLAQVLANILMILLQPLTLLLTPCLIALDALHFVSKSLCPAS